jgi:hypothetical protein
LTDIGAENPAGPRPTRVSVSLIIMYCLLLGTYEEEVTALNGLAAAAGGAAMTDRSHEMPQDADLRNLVRVVSACTLGLWAFAAGLLIGVFLFS